MVLIDDLRERIQNPKETLDTELKQWIDPTTPEGIAKIAKECIALRNNNGGILIIGFDDKGQPTAQGKPAEVRATYHVDVIQDIIGKYALIPFPIEVEIIERDGTEYPVIVVPGGLETPVATKCELPNAASPKKPPLIRRDVLYVRTLASNHTVSTSIAVTPADWSTVTKTCFDNREADIGGFVRRHLSTLDLSKIDRKAFAELISPPPPDPTALERAVKFLDFGKSRFDKEIKDQQIKLPRSGFREVSLVIDGEFDFDLSTSEAMWRLEAAKPNHSGWTPWVNTFNAADETQRPHVANKGWEALIVELGPNTLFGDMIDFWRIDFTAQFYHLRSLEDDMTAPSRSSPKPAPNTEMDFYLQISRAAEILSVGLSFAQTMGCDPQSTKLAFAFRWTGLKGRYLTSWVVPDRRLRTRAASRDTECLSTVLLPMETPRTGITPFVEQIVNPLFTVFDGTRLESSVIEGIVNQTVSRRL